MQFYVCLFVCVRSGLILHGAALCFVTECLYGPNTADFDSLGFSVRVILP